MENIQMDVTQMDVTKIDWQSLQEMAVMLATTYGLNIFFALLIFFVGKWIARRVTNVATRMMTKSKLDKTLVSFADDVIFAVLITIVVIAAVNRLGIDTTHIAAMIAAAGLAVGLALQGSLSNLAAGVMIILFRPFRVGDFHGVTPRASAAVWGASIIVGLALREHRDEFTIPRVAECVAGEDQPMLLLPLIAGALDAAFKVYLLL